MSTPATPATPATPELNVLNLTQVSLERFVFFMRVIADNDLWDEALSHLHSLGGHDILVSLEPIEAVQQFVRQRVLAVDADYDPSSEVVGKVSRDLALKADPRTVQMLASHCGPGGRPPKFPGGGGDGGIDGG